MCGCPACQGSAAGAASDAGCSCGEHRTLKCAWSLYLRNFKYKTVAMFTMHSQERGVSPQISVHVTSPCCSSRRPCGIDGRPVAVSGCSEERQHHRAKTLDSVPVYISLLLP